MGILFWDTIINESPADCYKEEGFETISTNPCGELPLSAYSSCLLMHLNLFQYVDSPFTDKAEFMFEQFAKDVVLAQRIMDDVVDLELENIERILAKIEADPESDQVKAVEYNLWKKIYQQLEKSRRTGLGWLGLADTLAALNVKYDSDDAIQFAKDVQFEVATNSYKSSIIMAKERGSFPVFNHTKEFDHIFINRILSAIDDDKKYASWYGKYGRRNISNLTVAPTGSLSILAEVSSGIEPVFELAYNRKFKNGPVGKEETYKVFHAPFEMWYKINKNKLPFDGISLDVMSKNEFADLKKLSPYYKATATEIDPIQKIKLQAAVQKYNDHAVSVTHNVKGSTTVQEIVKMIYMAKDLGCKGFTIYREGSRSPILSKIDDEKKAINKFDQKDALKRPISLQGDAYVSSIKGETYIVLIGKFNNKPYEIFAFKPTPEEIKMFKRKNDSLYIHKVESGTYNVILDFGKQQYYQVKGFNKRVDADNEAICRMISLSLRHGVDATYVFEQMVKPNTNVNDVYKVIARNLKKYLDNNKISRKQEKCPRCGENTLQFVEGCVKCNCGFSRC